MKTLIPTLIAVLIFGTTQAQETSFASISKDRDSSKDRFTTERVEKSEPYIKIKARSDRKIILNWSPFKGAVSRYELERSADGRNFELAGMMLTSDDRDNEPDYYFTDSFRKPYDGPLYYRLRVLGQDGSVIYTPVTALNAVVTAH